MCEVTRQNFKNVYPDIEEALKKSTFVSIDSEFSGLISNSTIRNSLSDTGAKRYLKLKDGIHQIIALQIGISCFKFIRDWNEYSCQVYRFYIFPRSFGTFDQRFLCQSSSLEFLASYNFDFNKVVREGIPYLNRTHSANLRRQLASGSLLSQVERSVSLDDESWIQSVCSEVAQWARTCQPGDVHLVSAHDHRPNAYLLHLEVRKRFKQLWTFPNEKGILIKAVTREERDELSKPGNNTCLEEEVLDGLIGFTKVFNLLSDLKKPIVGHNLLLDLLIMYNQFYDPLPASLKLFKKSLNELFPIIYDTKYMSYELQSKLKKEDKFSSNSLGGLYDFFKAKGSTIALYSPNVKIEPGFYDSVDEQHIHEAGWDSFITGFCFVKMAHYFAVSLHGSTYLRPLTSTEHLSAVVPMRNMVNIVRANLSHLNLEGDDPISTRPPLLYISGRRNQKIRSDELALLFAKYGAIDFEHTSPYTVLAAVSNYGSVRDIVRDFRNNKDFKVERYRMLLHSRAARGAMWAGVVVPIGFCVWYIYDTIKQ